MVSKLNGWTEFLPDEGKLLVIRQSPVSGKLRLKYFDCTADEYTRFAVGALIQNAFPNLSAEDREFIITGITDEEWKQTFPAEEE